MPAGASVDLAQWWRSLQDPELDSLIERAVGSNLDLKIAITRLQKAQTQEYVVSGGTLPTLNLPRCRRMGDRFGLSPRPGRRPASRG